MMLHHVLCTLFWCCNWSWCTHSWFKAAFLFLQCSYMQTMYFTSKLLTKWKTAWSHAVVEFKSFVSHRQSKLYMLLWTWYTEDHQRIYYKAMQSYSNVPLTKLLCWNSTAGQASFSWKFNPPKVNPRLVRHIHWPDCGANHRCIAPNQCVCLIGWTGPDCLTGIYTLWLY